MFTVDYTYYSVEYGGTAVEQDGFPRVMREACAYVDQITYGRLHGLLEIPDEARLAACAVADVVQAKYAAMDKLGAAAGVKSFTTDGYSETLGDAAQLAKDFAQHRMDVAEIYLPRAHPLRYAGIW